MGDMADYHTELADFIERAEDEYTGVHVNTRGIICDGEPRIQRRGDGTAYFIACSRYPQCRHTESIAGFTPDNGA